MNNNNNNIFVQAQDNNVTLSGFGNTWGFFKQEVLFMFNHNSECILEKINVRR